MEKTKTKKQIQTSEKTKIDKNKIKTLKTPLKQRKAVEKYDKKHSDQVPLKFNKKTDKDIITRLNSKGNVQGYIKSLIRRDIGSNKKTSSKTEK